MKPVVVLEVSLKWVEDTFNIYFLVFHDMNLKIRAKIIGLRNTKYSIKNWPKGQISKKVKKGEIWTFYIFGQNADI